MQLLLKNIKGHICEKSHDRMLHALEDLDQADAQQKNPPPANVCGGRQIQILSSDKVIEDEREPEEGKSLEKMKVDSTPDRKLLVHTTQPQESHCEPEKAPRIMMT